MGGQAEGGTQSKLATTCRLRLCPDEDRLEGKSRSSPASMAVGAAASPPAQPSAAACARL
eukprot:CAMPEP_0115848504 /NCGR_PEP_ID=MMETSP0287-20121206/10957_1 /TAXON_ID=412157 /ORGANISM="Chrysochromulina rotalis, Strain UIO044" /LENGTH=59 /DNA_ID=CAMNT_0003302421 /DNA_START=323 /DNA_END=502 /DNA_ORIENTATION=+